MAKVSNEEQLEDEIIYEAVDESTPDSSGGESSFFEKNKNIIVVVAIALIVGTAGSFWYNNNQSGKSEEAHDAMYQAVRYFERDSFMLAMNGNGQNQGFIDIIDEYGSTDAGNLAKMYLGICYLKNQQASEAIETLESYAAGNDFAGAMAMQALGSAYEDQAEFSKAASIYEKAARIPGENKYTTPMFLMDAARCFEAEDNNDKAIKLYREIKERYPLSSEGLSADKYIARLGGEQEL